VAVTITIPEQSRQGTFTTSSFVIPAGVSGLSITSMIPDADYLALGNSVALSVDVSPNGTTWTRIIGFTWESTGGPVTGPGGSVNPRPSCRDTNMTGYDGQFIRVRLTVPNTMTLGFTIVVS